MTDPKPVPDLTEQSGDALDTSISGPAQDVAPEGFHFEYARVGMSIGKPLRWLEADAPNDKQEPTPDAFRFGDPFRS